MKTENKDSKHSTPKLHKFAKKAAIANNVLAVIALLLASTMIYLYFSFN